jgi:hypothetical protein
MERGKLAKCRKTVPKFKWLRTLYQDSVTETLDSYVLASADVTKMQHQ